MTALDWALQYAEIGWPIFPVHYVLKEGACSCRLKNCKRIGKHPLTKRGVLEATSDPAQIRAWWTAMPYANIGHATGYDGRTVMDVDTSGDKVGRQSLEALTGAYGPLPETLRCTTGSGGTHFYFDTPHSIKSRADVAGRHIDVRAGGGYVILPPSNHASGGRYEWQDWGFPVAPMPEWLAAKMMERPARDTEDEDVEEIQPEVKAAAEKQRLKPAQIVRLLDFVPPDTDRETWWKVGAILKKELGDQRGFAAWKLWSEKSKDEKRGWDQELGERQWISFRDNGLGVGSLYKFAEENGFRGFDAEAADAPEIRDEWLYVTLIKRFIQVDKYWEFDREQFDARYAADFQRGAPSAHCWKNENFRQLENVTYAPGADRIISELGQSKFNYWRPSGVEAVEGDVQPFLDHVAYLLPKPEEQAILLDYLAYQVQHPGEKVHWSILLYGVQGTGKSYLSTVMKLVLGAHNVQSISNEVLHENFTGWARACQFVVVEEMMAGKRMELMNKLKPMITEPWVSIREMYKPPYQQPNRMNFLFLTNHIDSILIDNTDRRYCVLKSEAEPHPEAGRYYGPLFSWTAANIPALAYYLSHRQLSIQPKAHAPQTEGKLELIRESMRPLDSFISDRVQSSDWPFNGDLVAPANLVKALNDFNFRVDPKEIGRALGRLGYRNLGLRRVVNGERTQTRLWAVRNFETYENMSDNNLRLIFMAEIKETPGVTHEEVIAASELINRQKPI